MAKTKCELGWTTLGILNWTAILLVLLLCKSSDFVKAQTSVGPPFPMTATEAEALYQFKKIIVPRIPANTLVANFSQDDLYLMGWLRSQSLNVRDAEQKFLKNVQWREQEEMDLINEENWTEFLLDYPAYVDTFDKDGSPTAEWWVTDWDVRKAVITGQGKLLSRWINRMFELNTRRLYRLRREGKSVTQAVLLADVEGFSYRQGCSICTQVFIRFGHVWENHFPDILKHVVAINMTPGFQTVLNGMRPFLSPKTKRALKTYIFRHQWLPFLDMQYSKSERSVRFGGTKERPN